MIKDLEMRVAQSNTIGIPFFLSVSKAPTIPRVKLNRVLIDGVSHVMCDRPNTESGSRCPRWSNLLPFSKKRLGLILDDLAPVTLRHKIIVNLYVGGSLCCFTVAACSMVE